MLYARRHRHEESEKAEDLVMKRLLLPVSSLVVLLSLARGTSAGDAPASSASNQLHLVRLSPAEGKVPGATGDTLTPGNSVEATFEYALVTAPKGKIAIYTRDVAPNPPHTAVEWPVWVEKGKGTVRTRFSVSCGSSVHISRVRFALFEQAPGGPQGKTLAEGFQDVTCDFVCGPGSAPKSKGTSK
jgi:hypothetical protein